MVKGLIAAGSVCAALLAGVAAAQPTSEATLRAELQVAAWPADIVKFAGDYRSRFPRGPFAAEAASYGSRAARAQRAIESKDVNLPRDAFAVGSQVPALRDDLGAASLGDAAAAARIAVAYRDGQGVPADEKRSVGWMHYAAALDNASANYELSRHYRRAGQMPQASRFQARAVELGYVLPPELDSVRK